MVQKGPNIENGHQMTTMERFRVVREKKMGCVRDMNKAGIAGDVGGSVSWIRKARVLQARCSLRVRPCASGCVRIRVKITYLA